jgi:hypothetical protein
MRKKLIVLLFLFAMLLPLFSRALAGKSDVELRFADAHGRLLPTRDGAKLRVGPSLLPSSLDVVSVERAGTEVRVTLAPTSARAVAELTRDGVGRTLAIVVDGVVQSAPVVKAAIDDGQLQITLRSPDDAAALAQALAGK